MKIHQKRWTKTLKIEFHLGMGISFKEDRKINALSRAKKKLVVKIIFDAMENAPL
jgi:hypothetical protein